jgi:hypothetical protein
LPIPQPRHIERDNRGIGPERHRRAVLRVFPPERRDRPVLLDAPKQDAGAAFEEYEPESPPVLVVMVDQQGGARICTNVANAAQVHRIGGLRLGIDRVVKGLAEQDEADRHQRRRTIVCRREVRDSCRAHTPSQHRRDQGDVDIMMDGIEATTPTLPGRGREILAIPSSDSATFQS